MTMTVVPSGCLISIFLLRVGLQRAGRLRLLPQALHGRYHVRLLSQEGLAERGGPLQVLIHALEERGKEDQRLHTGVPLLLGRRFHQRIRLERLVLVEPAVAIHNLERISRGCERLRHQFVGVKRDRRHQAFEFVRADRGRFGCGAGSLRLCAAVREQYRMARRDKRDTQDGQQLGC